MFAVLGLAVSARVTPDRLMRLAATKCMLVPLRRFQALALIRIPVFDGQSLPILDHCGVVIIHQA